MLKVGVVGATGYAGEELIKILLKHPAVKIALVSAVIEKPTKISEIFPNFKGKLDLECKQHTIEGIIESSDLVFLALPHTVSIKYVPQLIKAGKSVIDISADYRLKDALLYKKWYKIEHTDKNNLKKTVYGLPELYRKKIRDSKLVANPGCYPTASILSSAPLLKKKLVEEDSIIIDAKSGYSGAGRKPDNDPFMQQLKDNLRAYKPSLHQHIPEIEQELTDLAGKEIKVVFVPHLIPIERGILTTAYFKMKKKISEVDMVKIFENFYANEPFVRILRLGEYPQTRDVLNTNFCLIGIKVDEERKTVIVISVIDNLVKGASGQAVQNMNLMCGFKETEALQ